MKQYNILLLPFMQIPSGHHQVADTLMAHFSHLNKNISYDKIDILSYSYGKMERAVSAVYLSWISLFPNSYHWLYYYSSYKNSSKRKRNMFYGSLFLSFFKKLISEKNPDLLVCTHALPSNLASRMKQQNQLKIPVINVYTDYFVNRVWGLEGIDYHFVPSLQVKADLLEYGIQEERIFVTGIPVHPFFQTNQRKVEVMPTHGKIMQTSAEIVQSQPKVMLYQPVKNNQLILVTGGSLGVGGIEKLLLQTNGKLHFYVLCGKNDSLFQRLVNDQKPNITPFPYIESREKMNELYEQVDAVLTKPGGVTISECLMKRKPIFVYHPLPGQEKINVERLSKLGVVMPVDIENGIEKQILKFFHNREQQHQYNQSIERYHQSLVNDPLPMILQTILNHASI